MLHTMLLYSQLKPVLAKPLLYEEYKINSYLLNFSPDIILHFEHLKTYYCRKIRTFVKQKNKTVIIVELYTCNI